MLHKGPSGTYMSNLSDGFADLGHNLALTLHKGNHAPMEIKEAIIEGFRDYRPRCDIAGCPDCHRIRWSDLDAQLRRMLGIPVADDGCIWL